MPKIIGEKKINRLTSRLKNIEEKLLKTILKLQTSTTINIKFYNEIRKEINKSYERFRQSIAEWSKLNIPITYNQNIAFQVKKIKALKFKPPKIIGSKKLKQNAISRSTKKALIQDFNSTMIIGLNSGEKTLLRLTSLTQQLNIAEKEINKIIGEESARGTLTAKKRIQKDLEKKALDKKYITIINKNGKPEQWKVNAYAELVARTKLSEAQSMSTTNVATSFGSDLIQVSSHNTTTPICLNFEGKIYSISGKDKDFEPLSELSPFHPNCLHTMSVIFKEILEIRGQLKQYSEFSKGKTNVPPNRKSFIPNNDLKTRLENKKEAIKKSNLSKTKKEKKIKEIKEINRELK